MLKSSAMHDELLADLHYVKQKEKSYAML